MANVHSHAFQRDLRGRRRAQRAPRRRLLELARGDVRGSPSGSTRRRMRDVAGRVYGEMAAAGYGAVGEFHYVHHRPTARRTRSRTRWRSPWPRRGRGGRPADRPAPRRLPPRRASALPRRVASTTSSRAWTRCGSRGLERRRRRPQRARRAGGLAARDRRATPTPTASSATSTPHEQPRELDECRAEHGCSPIELLQRTGFLSDRTTVVHGIHVDDARRRAARRDRHDRRHLPDDRGQPRRRPLPGAAATATPACGWPSAATATSSSTRSRRCASWRPAPAARAAPATRCSPRPATCGARWPATGSARLGLEDAGEVDGRPRPPAPARRARRRRHARARHLRVGAIRSRPCAA